MEDLIYVCIAVGIAILISLVEKKGKARKSEEEDAKKLQKVSEIPPVLDFDFDFEPDTPSVPDPPAIPAIILPEEGQRVSVDEPEEILLVSDLEKERQIAARRQRWRKAIIDAEILRPKF